MPDYCFTDLGTHEQAQCNAFPQGQIDAFAFITGDANISDYTSASDWNTAIAAGDATVFKRIRGEVTEGSEITQDNPVGNGDPTFINGYGQTFEWTDANVSADNDTLYGTLNGREGYLAVRMPNETKIQVYEEAIIFSASPRVIPSTKEVQYYKGIARWEFDRESTGTEYTEPTGIFDV